MGIVNPRILFASLEQRKQLRIRTIRIPRTNQLATRAHVLAGPAQYRAHDRLAGIKFSAGRGIIHNAQNDNLVVTIAKGKRQKRCALLQVWVGAFSKRSIGSRNGSKLSRKV